MLIEMNERLYELDREINSDCHRSNLYFEEVAEVNYPFPLANTSEKFRENREKFDKNSLTVGYNLTKEYLGAFSTLCDPEFESLGAIMSSDSGDFAGTAQEECDNALLFLKPACAALRKAYELCSMFRHNSKGKVPAWKVRAVAVYQLQFAKAALVQLLNRNTSNFQEPVRIKKYLIAVEGILADRRVRETDSKVQWMFIEQM